MARVAVEVGVRSFERELLVLVSGSTPGLIPMAGIASGSHPAQMTVVSFVAGGAGLRNRIIHAPGAMTAPTAQARVAAEEGKARVAIVIELLGVPVGGGVTVAALRALAAFVHIVRGMTAGAVLGGALIALAEVAGGAGGLRVFIGQRKAGRGVIEVRLLPGLWIVTGTAIHSQHATM